MSKTIPPLDPAWLQRAAAYQATLTMPAGALGRLLDLGRQLCAIQETLTPVAEPATVVVMAADHGVVAEGVSAYPQEVTAQMVANFLRGGAAINVLARRVGARLLVVDMGVNGSLSLDAACATGGWVSAPVAPGTANMLRGPAMTSAQMRQAVEAGRQIVRDYLVPQGVRVVALGEMGIGNTTSASALAAALTGQDARAVTGRGTGVDEPGWQRKAAVVEQALVIHFGGRRVPADPLVALTAVGGFEIAGLVGAALEAAARRLVVVLDGFISTTAGLVAARLEPACRGYFVAGHRGVEPGHRAVLETLELVPLLDLELRLGEGTGAALALPLIQAAADVMRDMATFTGAGVSGRRPSTAPGLDRA
jgi:nicotinate-nucleotide--dimethylbenzimidazole phosphoribosyltransferase